MRRNSNIMFGYVSFHILIIVLCCCGLALAGEWQTAGGQLCIDQCTYHNDGYHFYWCHVSDLSKSYTDGNAWGSWGYSDNSPQTHLKWDYCVPSKLDTFEEVNHANQNEQVEVHSDDDQVTLEPKGPVTTLYKYTKCYGACQFSQMRSICPVKSDHPLVFMDRGTPSYYCVNEVMPIREQLSAKYKMWCQTPCRRENADHYFCTTLYGNDDCSPRANVGSQGKACAYPCEKEKSIFSEDNDYFFCYTSKDNSTWEYCGQWDVPEKKKSVIEFTRYDYVCADYCQEAEDKSYEWCRHIYWDYNATTNEANLQHTWDYCQGHVPPGFEGWEIALIVLGVIGGIVAITVGLAYWNRAC